MINKKKFCRFTMFVKLSSGEISYWPNRLRVWCLRGDQFTDIPIKQIKNLLNHAKNYLHRYSIIELYDNTFSADDEQQRRTILKYKDGVIEKQLPAKYQEALKGFFIPKQFK